MKGIVQTRHPEYRKNQYDWRRWRLAYNGGRVFINNYLKKFSKREQHDEFQARRDITYCPRFAGAAIDDVKNSIYQRMSDIKRVGGDKTYQNAITGVGGGVDLDGSTMNRFLGHMILPDLLITSKVGIYVDMPQLYGTTVYENDGKRPYLYYYSAEEIPSWSGCYDTDGFRFTTLMLEDTEDTVDPNSGLVSGVTTTYRHYQLTDEGVVVDFYNEKNQQIKETVVLNLTEIPFVLLETNKSLMEDICDYQIALLNLESADISYILRSNYPLYVEQYDQRTNNTYGKKDTEGTDDSQLKRDEITIGASSGRRYPMGAHAPAFIHPSPEPVKASMAKEEQIKADIRKLLNLSLSSLEAKFASAESKSKDDRSLESGLSAIGLILEHGERKIAKIWSEYMNYSPPATIHYPLTYDLKTNAERRDEAKNDSTLLPLVPSLTYQKKIAVKIAWTLLGHLVSSDEWTKIEKEIENAKYISSDPIAITQDIANGLVSDATASLARGYAADEVEKAKKDHAERIARIQQAQSPGLDNPGARGVNDLNPNKGGNTNPDNTNRGNSGATSKQSGDNASE